MAFQFAFFVGLGSMSHNVGGLGEMKRRQVGMTGGRAFFAAAETVMIRDCERTVFCDGLPVVGWKLMR